MSSFYSPNDSRFMGETDARSIQNAIDAAVADGIRTVVIPRRCARTGLDEWSIGETILLPSDITLILDDCHLTLGEGIYANLFRNRNVYTPVYGTKEGRQQGIRIIGRGDATLDGGKGNELREQNHNREGRPHIRYNNLILLCDVTDYVLENFRCVNLRYWAINQIACKRGRLSNLRFWNGNHIPNQDGINFRIGCSDMIVENITGRTGDDVVALSAFPKGSDRTLLPEDADPDIHDISIRNVHAHTRQSVVALRNNDGAKMYRISIENIVDVGGELGPWGVVRIGENNYYRDRVSQLGETCQIQVRGVYSLCRGTVYLGASLKDSAISDVYAEGTSMYAISTYLPTAISQSGCAVTGGVTMENVRFDNIHYNGTAGHCDEVLINDPESDFHGTALDFRRMRQSDTLKRVVFRDVFCREDVPLFLVRDGLTLDIRN